MKRKQPKKPKIHYSGVSQFETLAITDATIKEATTNIPLPLEASIESAKDWVDHNEK